MRHSVRIAVKRAIADDSARAVVDIEDRSEAEVDAVHAQLGSEQSAQSHCFAGGCRDVAVPRLAERPHRRDRGESVAKALHAPTFVIDRNQKRRIA